MANVKPIILNASGVLEELSSSNTLIIPTLASHPGTNAPSGFVYIYSLNLLTILLFNHINSIIIFLLN